MNAVYLVIGGSLGTLARYYAGIAITDASASRTLATFAVNVAGSFIIGLFLMLGEERDAWSNALVLLVAVGFLGGFTTFSTLTWQTYQLLDTNDAPRAALYLGGSVIAGMGAVWAGAVLARAVS
jgi:CrcB protein